MTEEKEIIDIELDVDSAMSDEEDRWNELLDEIMAGNVIPVIGPDFQTDGSKNFHTQLVEFFAKKFQIQDNPETFSQLIYDSCRKFIARAGKPEAIYKLIHQVLAQVSKPPSELLVRLLATKKFPFVITTSFTTVVEDAMRHAWQGEDVSVLQFRNDPRRDLKPGDGDVLSIRQMSQPTVFYMFGKHSDEKNRYVVTDVDMMEFCRSWLAGINTPRVLTEAIKSRYLLVLGNNYSDWLFRFICYSLRSSAQGMRSSLMVCAGKSDPHTPLIQFLNRLETFIQRDPNYVVGEIERRLALRLKQQQDDEKSTHDYKTDVFLSYSRSDEHIVERLYDSLTARGLRVWYDRHNIREADRWKQTIVNGIRTTRVFVPVLTTNIENEIMEAHEYRTEWREAASMSSKFGGRTFIVPLAEVGFDFYNDLTDVPQEFSERNATWFDIGTDIEKIADVIVRKVEEVKQLEEKASHGQLYHT